MERNEGRKQGEPKESWRQMVLEAQRQREEHSWGESREGTGQTQKDRGRGAKNEKKSEKKSDLASLRRRQSQSKTRQLGVGRPQSWKPPKPCSPAQRCPQSQGTSPAAAPHARPGVTPASSRASHSGQPSGPTLPHETSPPGQGNTCMHQCQCDKGTPRTPWMPPWLPVPPTPGPDRLSPVDPAQPPTCASQPLLHQGPLPGMPFPFVGICSVTISGKPEFPVLPAPVLLAGKSHSDLCIRNTPGSDLLCACRPPRGAHRCHTCVSHGPGWAVGSGRDVVDPVPRWHLEVAAHVRPPQEWDTRHQPCCTHSSHVLMLATNSKQCSYHPYCPPPCN